MAVTPPWGTMASRVPPSLAVRVSVGLAWKLAVRVAGAVPMVRVLVSPMLLLTAALSVQFTK